MVMVIMMYFKREEGPSAGTAEPILAVKWVAAFGRDTPRTEVQTFSLLEVLTRLSKPSFVLSVSLLSIFADDLLNLSRLVYK